MLIRTERDFWQHVIDDIPPPVDGSEACAKFLGQRFQNSVPKSTIELPDIAMSLIEQFNDAREQAEKYTEIKRESENKLKQLLGTHEVGIIGGNSIRWQSISKKALDGKLLESEAPAIYDKYTRQSSYRRFTITPARISQQEPRKAG